MTTQTMSPIRFNTVHLREHRILVRRPYQGETKSIPQLLNIKLISLGAQTSHDNLLMLRMDEFYDIPTP